MTFAIVSCAGGAYIAKLIVSATPERDPVATDMKTAMLTSAGISLGVFAAGAALFSVGTYRFQERPTLKKAKKRAAVCPACGERYSTKKLRCPACGEENELHRTAVRQRRGLLDILPFINELDGPQRALVMTGITVVSMIALAAFYFSMTRM